SQYLKLGAGWCHGWDQAEVTPYAERLLLALGCTRFSTSDIESGTAQQLEERLPEFLKPLLNGCVISCCSARYHLGWLGAVARLPWSFLIYEGQGQEAVEDFKSHLEQFRDQGHFKLGTVGSYKVNEHERRTVAIFLREGSMARDGLRVMSEKPIHHCAKVT